VIALLRREWVAAALLAGSLWMGFRHLRFLAMLACVVVVVGGAVLQRWIGQIEKRYQGKPAIPVLKLVFAAALMLLAAVRCTDLVSNRLYFSSDGLTSFGTGLSWWFPERAMDFIAREKLPTQVFNSYEEGGFLLWKLGPQYGDFVDSRAIPFGDDVFERMSHLMQTSPDSAEWEQTADFYGINTVVFPLARYTGLKYVSGVLPFYCNSEKWQPVYLDEVSAVFVRRRPETEGLIRRFHVDCAAAQLPAPAMRNDRNTEFNRWSNAAALLLALGRNQESAAASQQALSIYSDSAALWFFLGRAQLLTGHPAEAEQALLHSARLEDRDATWSVLSQLYLKQQRYPEAIAALDKLAQLSPAPSSTLMNLAYVDLQTGRAEDALKAFDRAAAKLPREAGVLPLAEIDHGRASAWIALNHLQKAKYFEEQAVRLSPQDANYWGQLAQIDERLGLDDEARRASEQAAAAGGSQ
jgi:tetratricopeptide (TPR) repeat protein